MDKKTLNWIEKAMKIANENNIDFILSFESIWTNKPKYWHITLGNNIVTDQNLFLGLKSVIDKHKKSKRSNCEMRPCG